MHNKTKIIVLTLLLGLLLSSTTFAAMTYKTDKLSDADLSKLGVDNKGIYLTEFKTNDFNNPIKFNNWYYYKEGSGDNMSLYIGRFKLKGESIGMEIYKYNPNTGSLIEGNNAKLSQSDLGTKFRYFTSIQSGNDLDTYFYDNNVVRNVKSSLNWYQTIKQNYKKKSGIVTSNGGTLSTYYKFEDKTNRTACIIIDNCIYVAFYDSTSGLMTKLQDISDYANEIVIVLTGDENSQYLFKQGNAEEQYQKFVAEYTAKHDDLATMQALGLASNTTSVNSVIENMDATQVEKQKSVQDLVKYLTNQGLEESKIKEVEKAVTQYINTLKPISINKVIDKAKWETTNGKLTLYDGNGKPVNVNGWVLANDTGTYHLYKLKSASEYECNYDGTQYGNIATTDENGYGYLYGVKVEVSSKSAFDTLQNDRIKVAKEQGIGSKAVEALGLKDKVDYSNKSTGPGSTGGSSYSPMQAAGASSDNTTSGGTTVNSNGTNLSVNTGGETGVIKMSYEQKYGQAQLMYTESGEDYTEYFYYFIPQTNFNIDWPKKYNIINGNLRTNSHYVPTREEVQDVIDAYYSKAPNGSDNITDKTFAAMNREANETYNEYIPQDLRRMYGGDLYDVDTVVDPLTILAANLDCLEYEKNTVNWSTTDATNGWTKTDDGSAWLINNDMMNMLVLKAFGEYQYYSCYTVDKSKDVGEVTLYLSRSIMDQYTDFKDSIFKCKKLQVTKESKTLFNDWLIYLYYIDEKYAPLRSEKINMSGLTDSDYSKAGITNVDNKDLKEAIYYLVNQGYYTLDEISKNYGKTMTEELVIEMLKKIYNVVNRNVNVNTRVNTR